MDDKFKQSAFERFQKYTKIKRYSRDGSFNFDSKQLFVKHMKSKAKAWLPDSKHKTTSHINIKRQKYKPELRQTTHSNDSSNVLSIHKTTNQTLSEKYGHFFDLVSEKYSFENVYRSKRELNNLERNGARHNRTIQLNKQTKTHTKKRKPRKYRRMYFDEKESPTNITILNGQTALLTCTVRNVGNQTVSIYIYIYIYIYI